MLSLPLTQPNLQSKKTETSPPLSSLLTVISSDLTHIPIAPVVQAISAGHVVIVAVVHTVVYAVLRFAQTVTVCTGGGPETLYAATPPGELLVPVTELSSWHSVAPAASETATHAGAASQSARQDWIVGAP